MDTPIILPSDPVSLIRQLDPHLIRQRLSEMEKQRQALLVLLRAALAAKRQEVQHAR